MTEAVFVALLILARLLRAFRKVYEEVPARELRRRAAQNDEQSHQLYQAVRFERRLSWLLEILIALCLSGLLYITFSEIDRLVAIILAALIMLYFYAVSPTTRSRKLSHKLARFSAPLWARLLNYISPLLILPPAFGHPKSQQFYDVHDLIGLLKSQKQVAGSQISALDIDGAIAALQHEDKQVAQAMITKTHMKFINEEDSVGPILLSELHASRQKYFAVQDENKDIVGTVTLDQLADLKDGGQVNDVADKQLLYVNENWLLSQAAHCYIATGKKVYLVVDNKEKVTGIIGFDTILENLIGSHSSRKEADYKDPAKVISRR